MCVCSNKTLFTQIAFSPWESFDNPQSRTFVLCQDWPQRHWRGLLEEATLPRKIKPAGVCPAWCEVVYWLCLKLRSYRQLLLLVHFIL